MPDGVKRHEHRHRWRHSPPAKNRADEVKCDPFHIGVGLHGGEEA
ncbi:hypothetical protein [Aeromonas bivalvium]